MTDASTVFRPLPTCDLADLVLASVEDAVEAGGTGGGDRVRTWPPTAARTGLAASEYDRGSVFVGVLRAAKGAESNKWTLSGCRLKTRSVAIKREVFSLC